MINDNKRDTRIDDNANKYFYCTVQYKLCIVHNSV